MERYFLFVLSVNILEHMTFISFGLCSPDGSFPSRAFLKEKVFKIFQGDKRIQFNENEYLFEVVNFIEMKKEDYISFFADEL